MSCYSLSKEYKRFFSFVLTTPIIVGVFFLLPTIADASAKSNEPYATKLIQSARSLTVAPYQDAVFGIGFKNISGKTWKASDTNALTLRSGAKNESYFYDSSWKGKNVVMTLPHDTKPGELVYFWFTLEAPKSEGVYTEELSLYRGAQKLAETATRIPITITKQALASKDKKSDPQPSVVQVASVAQPVVESQPSVLLQSAPSPQVPPVQPTTLGTVSAFKLIQSASSVTLKQAERTTFSVGFKNIGTAVWKRGDVVPLSLRSTAKKESYFYDPSWKTQNVVMDVPADVQPGELVYFSFTLYAPIFPGTYTEKLFLSKGDVKIDGSDVGIPITVVPTSSTVLTGLPQSGNDLGAKPIETELPSSSATTDVSSVTPPIIPSVVQPPRIGIIDERTEQEPLIRVGLYSTKDPVRITANKDYEIRDSDGALLTIEQAGSVSTVLFDWNLKAYTLTTPKVSLGTNKYLRFGAVQPDRPLSQTAITPVPAPSDAVSQTTPPPSAPADQDIIFEILSYTNRPSWSSALNDNTFRTMLEVRYAPQTNRLWVVNELGLENYLKGIGETSNSSPYEYQKTLITAARTYAKYHIDRSTKHAADGFTVSPTEADQVYRGYGAEKRLPNVARAADETRGVIVTYGGKLAITPYYSQSDGRTRSWEEVWGGAPKPWLVGKPDPYCDGLPMLGHGVGMSARGAIGMALDHKPFEEILKYYYTGIELKRIY